MIAGNGVAGAGRKALGDVLHAAGETVFCAVTDKNRKFGRRLFEPLPDAEFRVVEFFQRGLPCGQSTGAGDGVGGQPAARVGGEQAQPVDFAGEIGSMTEGEQATE